MKEGLEAEEYEKEEGNDREEEDTEEQESEGACGRNKAMGREKEREAGAAQTKAEEEGSVC